MNYFVIILLSVYFLTCTFVKTQIIWAPYQVSIESIDENGKFSHKCCGIIINEEYILTTARCMYTFNSSTSFRNMYKTSDLIIKSGNFNEPILKREVSEIIVHESFNIIKYFKNDIALIKLNESLPIVNKMDIRKIDVSLGNVEYTNCWASLYNYTNLDNSIIYPFKTPVKLERIDFEMCYKTPTLKTTSDICTTYEMSTCNTNFERGVGMICNNKLVGILSHVHFQNPNKDCNIIVNAYVIYESIPKHIEWITKYIGNYTINNTNNNNNVNKLNICVILLCIIKSIFVYLNVDGRMYF